MPSNIANSMITVSASELALVGPETTCQLAPNSATTAQGTIAVQRPYSGGRQAGKQAKESLQQDEQRTEDSGSEIGAQGSAIDPTHPRAEYRCCQIDHRHVNPRPTVLVHRVNGRARASAADQPTMISPDGRT